MKAQNLTMVFLDSNFFRDCITFKIEIFILEVLIILIAYYITHVNMYNHYSYDYMLYIKDTLSNLSICSLLFLFKFLFLTLIHVFGGK